MSEEEIIDELERIVKFIDEHYRCYCDEKDRDCIQGLLDSYTKQKQYIDKLQKKNEQSQGILSRIKIAYMVHTKDCELLRNEIEKWEKILDK